VAADLKNMLQRTTTAYAQLLPARSPFAGDSCGRSGVPGRTEAARFLVQIPARNLRRSGPFRRRACRAQLCVKRNGEPPTCSSMTCRRCVTRGGLLLARACPGGVAASRPRNYAVSALRANADRGDRWRPTPPDGSGCVVTRKAVRIGIRA
jgi:hypothetical protein